MAFALKGFGGRKLIPKYAFLTSGVGEGKDPLFSFEKALRDAKIEKQNLVAVSSILPVGCKIIPKEEGLKLLDDGEITFCVLAKNSSKNKGDLVNAGVAIALNPKIKAVGYIAERVSINEPVGVAKKEIENLAKQMLLTKIGGRYHLDYGSTILKSEIASLRNKTGRWTTAVASVVFIT